MSTGWISFIGYDDARDDTNNRTEEVKTYNNSFANLMDDTNDATHPAAPYFGVYSGAGNYAFDSPTEDNNTEHMPNSAANPDTGDTPLVTTELWTARNKGLRYAAAPTLDTAYAPPAGTVALYSAASTSAAENDATSGVTAIDDIDGTLRAATPDRGAKEI